MSRARGSLAAPLTVAAAAAGTTWVSTLSWRGLTESPSLFLGPLLVLAALVAGVGAVTRWWRWPGAAVVATQTVVSVLVASWMLVGTPLPVGAGWQLLVADFDAATASARTYVAPVPASVPSVAPLLVAGGLGCLLLVDLLACTLRRVTLAGLPLLAVHSVPLGVLDGGLSWWVFAASAAGFLLMLFLHEDEHLARWGRRLGPAAGTGGRSGSGRTNAGLIGGTATALAIAVPLAVPTLDLHVFDVGPGTGTGAEIDLENPMTDMRRDLKRGADVPLVRVRTDDPDPAYLRIAVLNRFSAERWTSGDRDIPADQEPDGPMPPLEGVGAGVPRVQHDYAVQVLDGFRSTWLPTQAPINAIEAPGEWRYDAGTMDFIAADDGLDTAGIGYRMTAVELERDPNAMLAAPSGTGDVGQEYVELPSDTPGLVRELATSVTGSATSRFEKAVALQNWFRRDGGFTYDLGVDLGSGGDDLVAFLSEGGRTGYCEQFASAMAVMARAVGIPARVAVGFLAPERVGDQAYEYSSHDLHSWPELFIPGAGWTPFEPTPADRASGVPEYTRNVVAGGPEVPLPSASAAPEDTPDRGADASTAPEPAPEEDPGAEAEAEPGFPWRVLLGVLAGAAVLVLALLSPRRVRRARRERRLGGPDGTVEDAWQELLDTAVDLAVPWPPDRTPRETTGVLREHGAPAAALDVLVGAVERDRYGRPGETAAAGLEVQDAARTCVSALMEAASPRVQRRARWWPRSVVGRGRRTTRRTSSVETTPSGVVDHVG
ncbi:transglutaminase TgpA family protein [Nocardioides pantholopis]|uniref:transglutaminase TgpA family protein n=1 Tax=Nocardioides pantholopis TaxID=2483798 RepID=UPI000FD7049A|nr:DUF3488 and transglutaminase-like domain-containing protein [Nocardioides pantholopis]